MPTEQGLVVSLKGDRAIVKTARSTECESCSSSHACDITTDAEMMVEAINVANATVGDTVILEIPNSIFLAGSFLIYLVPITALVVGVFVGSKAGTMYHWDKETAGFLFGMLFFGLCLLVVRAYGNKKFSSDASLIPHVTSILKSKN